MDQVIMQMTNIVAVLMKTFSFDIVSNGITMDWAIMQIVLMKSLCFDIISIRCHFMNLLIIYRKKPLSKPGGGGGWAVGGCAI